MCQLGACQRKWLWAATGVGGGVKWIQSPRSHSALKQGSEWHLVQPVNEWKWSVILHFRMKKKNNSFRQTDLVLSALTEVAGRSESILKFPCWKGEVCQSTQNKLYPRFIFSDRLLDSGIHKWIFMVVSRRSDLMMKKSVLNQNKYPWEFLQNALYFKFFLKNWWIEWKKESCSKSRTDNSIFASISWLLPDFFSLQETKRSQSFPLFHICSVSTWSKEEWPQLFTAKTNDWFMRFLAYKIY